MDNKTAMETIQSLYICGMRSGKRQLFEALKVAIEALESAEPKWIPCSERLPRDDEPYDVLCCNKYGAMMIGCPFVSDDSETGYSADGDCYLNDCVAWMLLPEAYKEERR